MEAVAVPSFIPIIDRHPVATRSAATRLNKNSEIKDRNYKADWCPET
jgi:hypothetical protein